MTKSLLNDIMHTTARPFVKQGTIETAHYVNKISSFIMIYHLYFKITFCHLTSYIHTD